MVLKMSVRFLTVSGEKSRVPVGMVGFIVGCEQSAVSGQQSAEDCVQVYYLI